MRPKTTAAFLFVLLTATVSLLGAAPPPCTAVVGWTEPSASDFEWRGELQPGATIEIQGLNGHVRAEASSGREVEVVANKRAGDEAEAVDIQVVAHARGVTICTVYGHGADGRRCQPGARATPASRPSPGSPVDFTLRVPAGVRFVGRTVNGSVEAASLKGDVEAYTVNGDVGISTEGTAVAQTVNGSIAASLGATGRNQPLQFRTVNGEITIDLPAQAGAEVWAEAGNGEVVADFPMVWHKFGQRGVTGVIGDGGGEVMARTVNGSVRLRRSSDQ